MYSSKFVRKLVRGMLGFPFAMDSRFDCFWKIRIYEEVAVRHGIRINGGGVGEVIS
jgi:hypothetical protein